MGRLAKATMGREVQVNMDVEKRKDLLHDLELKHQMNTSDTEILIKDEDVRRLRVRILMLRDENTSLRDQISQNNDTNTKLSAHCEGLSAQIEAKMDVIRLQEQQLRKQEREYTNLKAELQAMNNATQDSTNLLAEKLSLSRELAVLKPEIEHLRSQVNQQQATLAEKLALERQVNTLEVELANEKKATKRAMQKRESNDRVEDELRKNLREVEKKLTAEKSERERLEDQLEQEKRTRQFAIQDQDSNREVEADLRKKLHEAQRQLRQEQDDRERLEGELQSAKLAAKKSQKNSSKGDADDELRTQIAELKTKLDAQQKENAKIRHESQTTINEAYAQNDHFEKKIEKLKTKLRETQEQLKQCQADLRKVQQSRSSVSDDTTKIDGRSQVFRKRKTRDMGADDFAQIEIQTPAADNGKERRALKKRGLEPTLPGEKSTFSITPFLNRTKSIMEDTPKTDAGTPDDSVAIAAPETDVVEPTKTVAEVDAEAGAPTEEVDQNEPTSSAPVEDEKPKAASKSRGRPKKVLGEAPSAKRNAQPILKKSLKAKNSLEKVTEEANDTNQENQGEAAEAVEKTTTVKFSIGLPQDESTSSSNSADQPKGEQPKKKKRKVLGSTKTLFDEEEGEAPPVRKPAKVQLGGKRALGKAVLNAQKSAFAGSASFSPLKKERRGVGASFLA
ncbi:uncharacterized protein F4807DRAFT_418602 [Annulohypoxylon truncatum]|uniref:uncharacterized protein n=1 Tax=Annulohypoxylon truncatum TaxID=327061 RepID=UPI002008DECE|nr:uncharacterized protein F4807DRAFT_418602 [Annulohypoxylon truncatum]KAI1211657.1 hypothetical protein F4807DRAFT_418602 [Annulohypoxylon truncatum]